jgi:hypothetical protein
MVVINKNTAVAADTKKKPAVVADTKKKPAVVADTKKKPAVAADTKKKPVVADTKKKPANNAGGDKGALDEKGNPFPIPNPEGGDPICPGGYKIDYQFDIMDEINPLFRCISSLKDPSDGIANKMLEMANNPSSGVANVVKNNIPVGGKHRKKMTRRLKRNGSSHRRRSHRRAAFMRGFRDWFIL